MPLIIFGGLSAKRFSSSSSGDFFDFFLMGLSSKLGSSRSSVNPRSGFVPPVSVIGSEGELFAVKRSISANTASGVSSIGP